MTIQDAFFQVCNEAQPSTKWYVSLYISIPYYGGPEEGGWWGHDTHLIAHQAFSTEVEAEYTKQMVERLAAELNQEEKRQFGAHCLNTMEWLELRGLDADFLPEVDGESTYFVVVEDRAGSSESRGCRHYE